MTMHLFISTIFSFVIIASYSPIDKEFIIDDMIFIGNPYTDARNAYLRTSKWDKGNYEINQLCFIIK